MLIGLAYAGLWLAALAWLIQIKAKGKAIRFTAGGLVGAAVAALSVGLVQRSLSSGHWPLTNRYEFSLFMAWSILVVFLLFGLYRGNGKANLCVILMALLVISYAITRPAEEHQIHSLLPVLRSGWLQVHVISSVLAFGLLAVAAGVAIARLWPQVPVVDELFYVKLDSDIMRAVNLGFLWLTMSLLAGAIWARAAWGRYWGWDPKESWTLVTWLWYLLVLHLRPLPRWRGRPVAVLVLIGLLVLVFGFIGTPWLVRNLRIESLHGF
jgi:cytochrome c-type biogenesis protein CcsB